MRIATKVAALIGGASVLTVGLGGCTPAPVETKGEDAQKLVDAMTYARAKNGLCFGVATVQRVASNGAIAINQVVVPVECKKIGL